nr:MAG TPA_asm: DSBA-like thioredoxin domain [Caudoviricetes sp.]
MKAKTSLCDWCKKCNSRVNRIKKKYDVQYNTDTRR